MTAGVQVNLLGGVELWAGGAPVRLDGARPRGVLAVLALSVGRPVSPERLIDDIWGDAAPPTATNTLQVHVSAIRRALRAVGGAEVVRRPAGYVLELAADAVDVHEFQRLVAEGTTALRAGSPARAVDLLTRAAGCWRGDALAGLESLPFARDAATALEEARLAAVEERIDGELACGRSGELIAELTQLVARHPYRERGWAQLVLAEYRAGRQRDALETCQRARRLLADELGLEPGPELRRLEQAVLTQDPSLAAPSLLAAAATSTALPPELELVGRAALVDEVNDLVREGTARVVTLIGIGGTGKTALATAVAHRLAADERRVVFVDLAPAANTPAALVAIAEALGAEPGDDAAAIGAAVTAEPVVAVLDNLEHLSLADDVAALIAAAPCLTILGTSRIPLRLASEHLVEVPALAVLGADGQPGPAMLLFAERAEAAAPGFQLDDHVDAVAAICQRLDGLALAVELAAARVRSLRPADLLARLDHRLALLVGGPADRPVRQRSLRAALDASFELLADRDQRLFAALSVAAGPFDLDLAEALDDAPSLGATDALDTLVDHRLVLAPDALGRYRMLDTLREYATDRAEHLGLTAAANDALARHVSSVVTASRPLEEPPPLRADETHVANALEWLLTTDRWVEAATVAAGMRRWWLEHGRLTEALGWYDRLRLHAGAREPLAIVMVAFAGCFANYLGRGDAADLLRDGVGGLRSAPPGEPLVVGLCNLGAARMYSGDVSGARLLAAEARRVAEATAYDPLVWYASDFAAFVAAHAGEAAESAELLEAVLRSSSGRDQPAERCVRLACYADALLDLGCYEEGREAAEEALELAQTRGIVSQTAFCATVLSFALTGVGDPARGLGLAREAARSYFELGVRQQATDSLLAAATALAELGDHAAAATYFAVADDEYERLGVDAKGRGCPLVHDARRRLPELLGPERTAAIRRTAARRTPEDLLV